MVERYDAIEVNGDYTFTFAFPHEDMPDDDRLRSIIERADDQVRMAMGRALSQYCVQIGGFHSSQVAD
jgi:hypothetical protein